MSEDRFNQYYFNEMRKEEYNSLDKEDLRETIKVAQSGYNYKTKEWETEEAIEAKAKIIKSHVRFAPFIVHRVISNSHPLFMDCISECHVVIVKCIIKYDLEAPACFSTYARTSMNRHIWRFLREQGSAVKMPINVISDRKKKENEIYNSPDALDKLFNQDFEPVNYVCSLDYNFDDGTKLHNSPFKDIPCYKNGFNSYSKSEMKGITIDALRCLTDNQKLIIKNRFLFEGEGESKKLKLIDVAAKIGISGERVRQIEKEALGKMRKYIEDIDKIKIVN